MKPIKDYVAEKKAILAAQITEMDTSPSLIVVQVMGDPASDAYVRSKRKVANEIGINFQHVAVEREIQQEEMEYFLQGLSDLESVNSIILQLPLPAHLNPQTLINCIDPKKDVDCLTTVNEAALLLGVDGEFLPCTPKGIIDYLEDQKFDFQCNAVVLGRGKLVGKPIAKMLQDRGATVTVCHSKTKDIKQHTLAADLIICAVGKKNFLTSDMVKEGAVVIDAGINRNEEGKLCGDAEPLSHAWVSPVPGGVGLLTVLALMENCLATIDK